MSKELREREGAGRDMLRGKAVTEEAKQNNLKPHN